MPHLTVAQNIFIGREQSKNLKFLVDDSVIVNKTKELFRMMNLDLDPNTRVSELTVAKQQMVEIAKALSYDSRVLIMDEPTAALTESEIRELFRIITDLRDKGVGIVYISHRMDELNIISDRITVMRDGSYIDTVNTKDVTRDKIISMMVGRAIYDTATEMPEDLSQEVILEVRNLNRGRLVKDVSFQLKRGEILGFSGLMGAGRTEVARTIIGAEPCETGDIDVNGKNVKITSPNTAVKLGIGYLSEDRKQYGLALGMDVDSYIALSSYDRFTGLLGWVRSSQTAKEADKYIEQLRIKTPSIRQKVKNLSGGNQQKVIIGKWLARDCDVLIFDEPTRGIDVGAKSEIYKLLNELASQGKSIIMISSELPEVLRMSHRILVMCEGRITGELHSREFKGLDGAQERIMEMATTREPSLKD
jgi:ribose transport system ATP-binding protein